MQVQNVIDYIDEVLPNPYSPAVKAGWIATLEAELTLHVLGESKELHYPEDAGTELFAKAPYDKMYGEYLEALINYRQGEYAKYANSSAVFNETQSEFYKYKERTKYDTDEDISR